MFSSCCRERHNVVFQRLKSQGTLGDVILDVPARMVYLLSKGEIAMSSSLTQPHFHNEEAAYAYVEARVWPQVRSARIAAAWSESQDAGKTTRIGTYKCTTCRKPFTVKVGTIFEASHIADERVASGDLPDRRQQEGDQQQPASSHPGGHVEDRLVHVAPHPRGDALGRSGPVRV